jgi:hypothetical protein
MSDEVFKLYMKRPRMELIATCKEYGLDARGTKERLGNTPSMFCTCARCACTMSCPRMHARRSSLTIHSEALG